eukprot:12890151-Prorocentrum_lima.AAC.1
MGICNRSSILESSTTPPSTMLHQRKHNQQQQERQHNKKRVMQENLEAIAQANKEKGRGGNQPETPQGAKPT